MPNLVGIFVSGTYLTVTYDVHVAVGCGLAYLCLNVEFICPLSIIAIFK